ncbi:SDR family oxidoreductase [Phanerochaete sordida]|uniref:SDR family oxidoreductase n=1 Tax=Phanerochaete sordida TaxID=48140 RepID=A0A9P3LEI0_9APHY|nr:SDR family oxidoreductase [Phanerochaete sordida]
MSASSRVWLVTGSSSGFGLTICKLALERGNKVVATLRRPSDLDELARQYPPNALLVVQVDVTEPDDIASAFRAAKARFGRVDVVFNNAGTSLIGEVEGVPDADARRLMDVDFWGAAAVSREAVRFFREDNPRGAGGTLLVMSSSSGHCAVASMGYYCAAKFALEGLSEALALELDPAWNIKVCIIAPGFFRTQIGAKTPTVPVHPAYAAVERVQASRGIWERAGDPARSMRVGDVEKAGRAIYEVSTLEQVPLRLFLGTGCIERVRRRQERLGVDLDASVKWSEDLQENE